MTIYTLYVKTHKQTGLKYLGQTLKDPITYKGSGVVWNEHLKKFGDDIETEILFQTSDKDERNYWGRYYSALYKVTTAVDDFGDRIWANMIPETGGGGGHLSGDENCMKNPKIKQKHLLSVRTPEYKNIISKSSIKSMANPVTKKKHSESLSKTYEDPSLRQLMSKIATESSVERLKDGSHNLLGSNNHRYDSQIYNFINDDGRKVSMTKSEFQKTFSLVSSNVSRLVSGDRKSHRGWKLSV